MTPGSAVEIARAVRKGLLRRIGARSDLAGQCGIASMLVAAAVGDPLVLRVGFYMKHETIAGRRGRSPYRHAWCQIGQTIVDVTATQFSQQHRAVHVTRDRDSRYIETANGVDAIAEILHNWRAGTLSEYAALAKRLRAMQRKKEVFA